jgi:hypothetical protein
VPADTPPSSIKFDTATAGGVYHWNGASYGRIDVPSPATSASVPETVSTGSVQTTDGTVTTIVTVTPTDNKNTLIHVACIGRKSGGSTGVASEFFLCYRKTAGVITKILQAAIPASQLGADDAAYNVGIAISGATLLVQVTGKAAETLNWYAVVKTIEVA